jgi:UDP-N-acetylmuramoyl-tripeptide--D-alanyl-D-alanine ligase
MTLRMTLREMAEIWGAPPPAPEIAGREPRGFSIDSRTIRPGELFFAIRGRVRDGHAFVREALERGACAAVVSDIPADVKAEQVIRVRDTVWALGELARIVRLRWGGTVIGITGSSGKTMTKELVARLLEAGGYRVIKTIGNYNNIYGLPLSLLGLIAESPDPIQYAVLEMGMSARGEIAHLSQIARPNIGVVTTVSAVHLEFFPSVEAIAEAKAELVDALPEDGLAVLNADNPLVARMQRRRTIAVRTFGIESEADVRARDIRVLGLEGTEFTLLTTGVPTRSRDRVECPPSGEVRVRTPLLGRHQVLNILAATAVAEVCGVPLSVIAEALATVAPYPQRGKIVRFPQGFAVIDDSYNSNPRSLLEMVRTLREIETARRRIVVAGEMLELGESAAAWHRECGREIARLDMDIVIGVRGLTRDLIEGAREAGMDAATAFFLETPEEAGRWLAENARPGDVILIKGSRAVGMERAMEVLARGERDISGGGEAE